MKKSFLPSFSKGLIAFSFCAAAVAMTACSESSSSGGGATAPDNPSNPIVSNCALANKYLPAYPAIAYEDAFGGGCQATVQIPIAQATEYSDLLVANGFERTPLSTESFSSKKNISIDSALTMTVSYSAGNLVSSLQEVAREYEFGVLSLIAENFLDSDFCTSSWQLATNQKWIYCSAHKDITNKITDYGWIKASDNRTSSDSYFIKYNDNYFNLYGFSTVYIQYEPNPSSEVQNLLK